MKLRLPTVLFLAATAALPAQDDRDRTTPTAAIWSSGQTSAQLDALVNQGWRPTDIEIDSVASGLFTVSMVQNTGTYAKPWWWYFGVTAAQLGTALAQNNGRLVDLEPYDDNGTTRFVAIMVSNTGADAKAWWWGHGMTTAQVASSVSTNNARLTSLRRYTVGATTHYAVVMISNTGADQRNWGYLYGASAAAINQNVAQFGNRIYGIERVGTDAYDVILVQNAGFGFWYYFDLTGAGLTALLEQNIGRLVDVERHITLGGTRFTAVLLDNANALEDRARAAFYGAAAGGLGTGYGFYLKEVNGPVLAQMRPDFHFEPASLMKTLYHVHAMKRVSTGARSLSDVINVPSTCGVAGTNRTLEWTLSNMMEFSDNMATLAISNDFGMANIQATAGALGMSGTVINFTIGCQSPVPVNNELTLRDVGRLHEQVANGYLGGHRAKFYSLMAESQSFPSGTPSLSNRIDAEAAALSLPNTVRDAFKSALHIAYKPGGAGINTQLWYAEGGWVSVPFKNAQGTIQPREYVFGVFNHDFTNETPGATAMYNAELELVFDRVGAALATWSGHPAGSFVVSGTGCPGSAGSPLHTASGTPEINRTLSYLLSAAPTNAPTLIGIGFGPTAISLTGLGAPDCTWRVLQPLTLFDFATGLAGSRTFQLSVPNSPGLIGTDLYTQYFVFDPAANAFGATVTNAIHTTIDG